MRNPELGPRDNCCDNGQHFACHLKLQILCHIFHFESVFYRVRDTLSRCHMSPCIKNCRELEISHSPSIFRWLRFSHKLANFCQRHSYWWTKLLFNFMVLLSLSLVTLNGVTQYSLVQKVHNDVSCDSLIRQK